MISTESFDCSRDSVPELAPQPTPQAVDSMWVSRPLAVDDLRRSSPPFSVRMEEGAAGFVVDFLKLVVSRETPRTPSPIPRRTFGCPVPTSIIPMATHRWV